MAIRIVEPDPPDGDVLLRTSCALCAGAGHSQTRGDQPAAPCGPCAGTGRTDRRPYHVVTCDECAGVGVKYDIEVCLSCYGEGDVYHLGRPIPLN